MKNTSDILYTSEKKRRIREEFILPSVLRSKSLFDFYGAGEMYRLAMDRGWNQDFNILSIDNDPHKAKELKKLPNTRAIGLKELCDEYTINKDNLTDKKRFGTIWIDYCGQFDMYVRRDLSQIRDMMTDEGELFFTFMNCRETLLYKGAPREEIIEQIITKIYKFLGEQRILSICTQAKTYESYVKHKKTKKENEKPSHMIVYKFLWKKQEETSDKVTMVYEPPAIFDLDKEIEKEENLTN